jgi:hypothetical protein
MSGPAAEAELAQLFGITERTARRAVAAARAEMVAEGDADRDTKRAEARAVIRECIRVAMTPGRLQSVRTALAAMQMLIELDGLAEATRFAIEHSTFNSNGAVLGKKELLERLAELRARDN